MQSLKMALKSILANKMRSLLTMLGIIIGIASVITMIAVIAGATAQVTADFESMGTNLISVSVMGRGSGTRSIDVNDMLNFASENSDVIAGVAPVLYGSSVTAKNGTVSVSPSSFIGTNGVYATVSNKELSGGRFINDDDTANRRKVAIIGQYLVNELFYGLNPIGETIRLNGDSFEVVGVLKQVSTGASGTADDAVIIPYTTAQRFLKNMTISSYNIQGASSSTVDAAMERLNAFLYKIFQDDTSYRVMNQAEILEMIAEVTAMMSMVLGGVAGISLLVGGIGIMNIMLVSVTERTREIGIRKAIGARRRDILTQFIIEAIVVSGLGGIIGILCGNLLSAILGRLIDVEPLITPGATMLAFGFSAFIGVFFGWYPAAKASKLHPIEALRVE